MFQPVEKTSTGQLVLQKLRDYIVSSGLQIGDVLPGERELAKMMEVSRNTVREVLKSIELTGAIDRRPKRGTVLSPMGVKFFLEMSHSMMPTDDRQLPDLMEARRVVEVGVLPLVIERATEADYEQMEAANRLMIAKIESGQDCTGYDVEFHKALISAAGNRYLQQFCGIIQEMSRLSNYPVDTQNDYVTVKRHRKLVEYLRNGDIKNAIEELTAQLSKSSSELAE